jgi:hypothetical protein
MQTGSSETLIGWKSGKLHMSLYGTIFPFSFITHRNTHFISCTYERYLSDNENLFEEIAAMIIFYKKKGGGSLFQIRSGSGSSILG